MAQITTSLRDIQNQTGLSEEDILQTLPLLGVPTNRADKDELHLEITPNRPDMLSSEGISRALNLYFGKPPNTYVAEEGLAGELIIDTSVRRVRPFIAMARVDGVSLDDYSIKSIIQIQEKLHETLGRKRKKVAIGIHNADAVKPPYKYFACSPEAVSFVPLDMHSPMTPKQILHEHPKGIEYRHLVGRKCPLITDADENVLSFPPIINGELTRVSENTKNLLIDVTGTSKDAVHATLNILVCMLADRGGKIKKIKCGKELTPNLTPHIKKFSIKRCERLLGIKFTESQIKDYLLKMGYSLAGPSAVLVPPYRADIMHEVDIYEDIAIAHGYDNFTPTLPQLSTTGSSKDEHPANAILVGAGFLEIKSWLLTSPHELSLCGIDARGVKIKNPLTEDFTTFRPSLIPGLLRVFSESKNERLPQKIYEIGTVSVPEEKEKLCVAILSHNASFSKIKSVLELLMRESNKTYTLKKEEGVAGTTFIEGRCATINLLGKSVGRIGEIHPQVLENLSIEHPVALFEIDADF
ncbi:MAG: phenylalanine--tRNA ligase subunit beta [Candidatus Anstonellales archaeon]